MHFCFSKYLVVLNDYVIFQRLYMSNRFWPYRKEKLPRTGWYCTSDLYGHVEIVVEREHSVGGAQKRDSFEKKSLSFCLSHLAVGSMGREPTSLKRNHCVHWLRGKIVALHISPSQQFGSLDLKWRWVRLRTTYITIFSSPLQSSVKVGSFYALYSLTLELQKWDHPYTVISDVC